MRVKIGDQWFDGTTTPIMVELGDQDKRNIAQMPYHIRRYTTYNIEVYSREEILRWMKDEKTLLELSVQRRMANGDNEHK